MQPGVDQELMHTWSREECVLAPGAQEGARSTATGATSGEEQVGHCDAEMIQVHTPQLGPTTGLFGQVVG
jgi:hypothetical protein